MYYLFLILSAALIAYLGKIVCDYTKGVIVTIRYKDYPNLAIKLVLGLIAFAFFCYVLHRSSIRLGEKWEEKTKTESVLTESKSDTV
ncbi:MAG: hypothetical protein Q3992_02495 [Bacteroides sp.]|nr:hypothetical protein [Bacteroides sp.]